MAAIVPRDFQGPIVDRLAEAMLATAFKIQAAPADRRRITQQIGCALLEAPTGSGKTIMLATTAERVSAGAPVVWFWFAPFRGVIEQTAAALRQAAPGLRVRDPRADRGDIGSRPGDVFVATWASVAASNTATRRMRTDDDVAPALDTLVTRLRAAGLLLGAVVDEAHHSFRPNSEAFRFLHDVMRPDLLMLATATPDDASIEVLRRAMDIARFQRVAVSRAQAVAARLNKRAVKAVAFVARGANARLLDLAEVALRKAVEQHRALRHDLRAAGIPIVPLLLIQAASDGWTPDRVRRHLHEQLGFPEGSVGVHTANEPDPDVQALARDPKVEALVFKMAVATGFDAPRAAVLCALRPVENAAFGLQVIGRIMRVHPLLQSHPRLPDTLDTAYVFLGEAAGQDGLQQAADRMRAVRSAVEVVSDSISLYVAGVDGDHRIAIEDERGQSMLELSEPQAAAPLPPASAQAAPLPGDPAPLSLFGQLAVQPLRDPAARPPHTELAAPAVARRAYVYPMRAGIPVPKRLRTEQLPRDATVLVESLVQRVRFTAEHREMVRQKRAEIERREVDLFDPAQQRRSVEQAEISDLFARQNATKALAVSDLIDMQALVHGLLAALRQSIVDAGQDVPDTPVLRRALNVILVREPNLCRDALRAAMTACMDSVEADDLPAAVDSDERLQPSPLNLYGCLPPRMNTWEEQFAALLDRQHGRVLWWLRNPAFPHPEHRWGVRIMLPYGRGYYPDFVVCLDGRRRLDGIALAETKERTTTTDSEVKARTEHRDYGRAVMLRYDRQADRFIRVEYDHVSERNQEKGPFALGDLMTA